MQENIRQIKHQFMTYRNGLIGDQLRAAGITCYKIIFGLNLPQIANIAKETPRERELAQWLWNDKGVRESRLLATYIYPIEEIDMQCAEEMIIDIQTKEEADMLCFKLLRHKDFAPELIEKFKDSQTPLLAYCAKALSRNIE